MTAPSVAAGFFLRACGLGCGLGFLYGFLRPLRPGWTTAADGTFLAAALWCWIYLSFGICGGDIRLAYTMGMWLSCLAFDRMVGRWLRPVFGGFWNLSGRILQILLYPAKIISKFAKNMFASLKKWVTIVTWKHPQTRQKFGGSPYGKHQRKIKADQAASASQLPGCQDHADRGYCVRYGGPDRPSDGDL